MTIKEAIQNRIPRVRMAAWSMPGDYLRLPLLADGRHGPWAELYADAVQQDVLHIRPGSQRFLLTTLNETEQFEAYAGHVSPFEQHPDNFASSYSEI